MSQFNKFTILGERCTGTHYVQFALLENFELDYERGITKHFFGNEELLYDESMITFCVVRDPIDWVDSYFKRKHHVPNENRYIIENFVFNEWYSVYEVGDLIMKENKNDRNFLTGERFKNLLELRKVKNMFFLERIPLLLKNYYIIRYEDLRDNYEETMDKIKNKFQLRKKHNENSYKPIKHYKGTYTALYEKKPILISDDIQRKIIQNIDIEQEKILGYDYSCKKL